MKALKLYSLIFTLFLISSFSINADIFEDQVDEKINYQWRMAAVMIFRDEAPYLKEWLEYHKLIGVEHFYLYNNLSSYNVSLGQ